MMRDHLTFNFSFSFSPRGVQVKRNKKSRLTLDVDLCRRTLDRISSFLVSGHADEVSAVEDTVDPGDAKIATVLVPSRARRQRLAVDFPRVLDPRARLRLASQAHGGTLGDRVLAGAHGEVKVTVLAEYR